MALVRCAEKCVLAPILYTIPIAAFGAMGDFKERLLIGTEYIEYK